MGITEYEALSFQILSKLHSYMWPMPVKWDYKKSKLEISQPAWKLFPSIIFVVYVWFCGWSFIGTTIYVGYIHQREGFLKITWVMFILCWFMCLSFCLAMYLGHCYLKAILSTFNELLQLADDIRKGNQCFHYSFILIRKSKGITK